MFLAWKGNNNHKNNNNNSNQLTKATIYRAIDVIWKVYTLFFVVVGFVFVFFYGKVYVSLWAENVFLRVY